LSNREFRWSSCRKAMTDSPKLLNNNLIYTNLIVKTNLKRIDLNVLTFSGIGT
jgi:hypothetical protein